jgi:hypothetical protein
MIACGPNQVDNDEVKDMFKEIFSILKQKERMKIILTVQSGDRAAAILDEIATETLGEMYIRSSKQLTWRDLTDSSQRTILNRTVLFQGKEVSLNQLTSAEAMIDSLPLSELLQEKVLKIGEEPVRSASSGHNEQCYIDRTFNHNIVIKQDISSDKREGKFADLLAYNEQDFNEFSDQNPNTNVHWLEQEESGEFMWQQSQGKLDILRKYIDTHKPQPFVPSDIDKLLQQAEKQRVMIIADKAGMGKTTVLNQLSKRIKQKFPAHWLVRISLNKYTNQLEAQKGKTLDKDRVLEFVSKEVLKLESDLEKELFEKSFKGNEISEVVIMVDGFDEISPKYNKSVLDMLHVLKQTSIQELWVTTRPHLREELEDNLQQLSYTLQPLSEVEQVEFLKNFWLQNLNHEDMDENRLQIFATTLIRNLARSIGDKDNEFTGIPLQTYMLAEAFEKEFRSFYMSEKSERELPRKIDLLGLYSKCIERKYDKTKIQAGKMSEHDYMTCYLHSVKWKHQLLALDEMFPGHQVTNLQRYDTYTLSDELLARVGIVQRNKEGKMQFIHRTFAQFHVAEFLIDQLTNETEQLPQVQEILLHEVLLKPDHHVTRAFLNGFLEKSPLSKKTLEGYGEKVNEQWKNREVDGSLEGVTTALHTAAKEDHAHTIGLLLYRIKSGENSNNIKKILLATDDMGRTACHLAAQTNSVHALTKIREFAEAVTPTVTYSMLLAQDKNNKTAWQLAVEGGHVAMLEIMWDWAKEQTKPEQLRYELLLSKNKCNGTSWDIAAEGCNLAVLDKLWGWATELKLKPEQLRNEILLSKISTKKRPGK